MNTPPPPPPPSATPPPPPPAAPIPPPPPASGGSGSKVLVIILCVVLGLFVLIGGCAVACTYYAHKKITEYSASAKRNPQMAALSLAVALQPDIQVVSKDEVTGKMTVKNTKTGEIQNIDTNAYSVDNIGKAVEQLSKGMQMPSAPAVTRRDDTASASDNSNETASAPAAAETTEPTTTIISSARASALKDSLKKFPNYFNAYPGGATTAATLNTFAGASLGNYEFTTSDKPDAVVDFYEKKITGAGFTVMAKNSDTNDYGPTSTLVATRADPAGTFSVAAESKKDGSHVSITFSQR